MFKVNNSVFPFVKNGIDLNNILQVGSVSLNSSYTYVNNPIVTPRGGSLFITRLGRDITQQWACGLNESGTPEIYVCNIRTDRQLGQPSSVGLRTGFSKMMFEGAPISKDITFTQSATNTIGKSNNTVKDLYMQNAVTVVSDENYKTEIQDIPDNVLEAWSKVNFQMYKLNDAISEKGSKARFHFGVIAQRIKEAFDDAKIDFNDYGLLTYNKWDEIKPVEYKPAEYDDDNNIITPETPEVIGQEAGEVYMVRYDECMILEMAYQRKRLSDLEKIINSKT